MGGNKGSRSETGSTQWAHGLGEERHSRDELADQTTKSEDKDAARTAAVSAERWTAIVAGIKRLVDAYNAGAGRAVLSVEEESDQPIVTIAAAGEGPSLTAALEDTLICVHAHDAGGVARVSEVRLRPDRGDDATAAYVLQNWMQRL
jgi:hypothetical protein